MAHRCRSVRHADTTATHGGGERTLMSPAKDEPAHMAERLTRLRVFVSSTSESVSEVAAMRRVVESLSEQLENSHAITLRMMSWPDDFRPGVGPDAQSEINRQAQGYDIYLGLLGTRFGNPTARSESGTQEEFEDALSRYKKAPTSVRLLFYFNQSLDAVDPYKMDLDQLQKVRDFRITLRTRGVLSRDFKGTEHFVSLVRKHIFDLVVTEWQDGAWASAENADDDSDTDGDDDPLISADAETINEAEEDDDEPGFLDYVTHLNAVTDSLVATCKNISTHIGAIGTKFSERTEEVNAVKEAQVLARAKRNRKAERYNVERFRTVTNLAAADLSEFVSEFGKDVVAYRADNRDMLVAFRGIVAGRREFGQKDEEELEGLTTLVGTLKTVREAVGGFQRSMHEMPAFTRDFKKARRRGVSMLAELIAELSFSIAEIEGILGNS